MTQKQLDRLVSKWQDRLLAHDWTVTAKLTPTAEMDDQMGTCEWDRKAMTAFISIRDGETPRDTELTLVHEILHALTDNPNREAMLNRFAAVLYAAHHRK